MQYRAEVIFSLECVLECFFGVDVCFHLLNTVLPNIYRTATHELL
jgi:hypothetical protein